MLSWFFYFPRQSERLWGPCGLLCSEYRRMLTHRSSGSGVNFTAHIHVSPR